MRVDRRNAAPCLVGSNIAFRRSAFEKAGLFSADHAPADDREFQLRLWKAGGTAIYTPEVVAQRRPECHPAFG